VGKSNVETCFEFLCLAPSSVMVLIRLNAFWRLLPANTAIKNHFAGILLGNFWPPLHFSSDGVNSLEYSNDKLVVL